jgi:hypothetical protein
MQISDKFFKSYVETALWASIDEHGIPLDDLTYADAELAEKTQLAMQRDCAEFEPRALELIAAYNDDKSASEQFSPADGHLAHDFWLTRNHHGAGFWDGDYPKPLGEQLTKLAQSFGQCDLYIGDDGKIYL